MDENEQQQAPQLQNDDAPDMGGGLPVIKY